MALGIHPNDLKLLEDGTFEFEYLAIENDGRVAAGFVNLNEATTYVNNTSMKLYDNFNDCEIDEHGYAVEDDD